MKQADSVMNANGFNGTKIETGIEVKVWAPSLGGRGMRGSVQRYNPNNERADVLITKSTKRSAYKVGDVIAGVGAWWLERI